VLRVSLWNYVLHFGIVSHFLYNRSSLPTISPIEKEPEYGADLHQVPGLKMRLAMHPLLSTSLNRVFNLGRKLSRHVHKTTLFNALRFRVPKNLTSIYFNTTLLLADITTWWLKETGVGKQKAVNNDYDAVFIKRSATRLFNQSRQAAEGQWESARPDERSCIHELRDNSWNS
jgi:hypothetical protein